MFLKSKDMLTLIAFASMMGAKTMGEAMELFKTLQMLKAHKKG